MHTIPGAYDVHLRFWYDDDWSLLGAYSAPSVSITAGANTIPFSDFSAVEPITITVTGIPSRYIGAGGSIVLNTAGIFDWVADDWVQPIAASSSFRLFAMPGIYDIGLGFEFEVGDDWDFTIYSLSRRNITAGTNTIPFSAFSRVPQMSITVTGIPERYIGNGDWVEMGTMLAQPETEIWIAGAWASPRSSSIRMNLWDMNDWPFNTPGTYDVHLSVWWSGGEAFYLAPSRRITTGNTTIPFSAFTVVPNSFTENMEHRNETRPSRSRARAHSPRMR